MCCQRYVEKCYPRCIHFKWLHFFIEVVGNMTYSDCVSINKPDALADVSDVDCFPSLSTV